MNIITFKKLVLKIEPIMSELVNFKHIDCFDQLNHQFTNIYLKILTAQIILIPFQIFQFENKM